MSGLRRMLISQSDDNVPFTLPKPLVRMQNIDIQSTRVSLKDAYGITGNSDAAKKPWNIYGIASSTNITPLRTIYDIDPNISNYDFNDLGTVILYSYQLIRLDDLGVLCDTIGNTNSFILALNLPMCCHSESTTPPTSYTIDQAGYGYCNMVYLGITQIGAGSKTGYIALPYRNDVFSSFNDAHNYIDRPWYVYLNYIYSINYKKKNNIFVGPPSIAVTNFGCTAGIMCKDDSGSNKILANFDYNKTLNTSTDMDISGSKSYKYAQFIDTGILCFGKYNSTYTHAAPSEGVVIPDDSLLKGKIIDLGTYAKRTFKDGTTYGSSEVPTITDMDSYMDNLLLKKVK